MKKLFVLLPIVAVITACGSINKQSEPANKDEAVVLPRDEYEARAAHAVAKREKQVGASIARAPEWMSVLPVSDNAVYANGSGVSTDMSMADYKAKLFAYGKICMAAGGKVSQQAKVFMQDNSSASYETSELTIRSLCPSVDLTGVETKEIKRVAEGTRFRSYALVSLPMGEANILQKRKDALNLEKRAVSRSDSAFEELDQREKSEAKQ
jgi:hypothetical protein